MRAVVDASAASEVALQRKQAGRFAAILEQPDVVLAPELFVAELSTWRWRAARMPRCSLSMRS